LPVGDRFRLLIQAKPQQRHIRQRRMNRQIMGGSRFVADEARRVQTVLRHRSLNGLQRWHDFSDAPGDYGLDRMGEA
jgi:hypothetical protein